MADGDTLIGTTNRKRTATAGVPAALSMLLIVLSPLLAGLLPATASAGTWTVWPSAIH